MAKGKHSVEVIKSDLEVERDLDLHEKGWVIQRIGWVIMFLIILFGLLGLFGEGVLSKRFPKVEHFQAEYDRFFRYEAEMSIEVNSDGAHISTVSLPQKYLERFRVVRIVPEPAGNQIINSEVIYQFIGQQNTITTIYLIPQKFGTVSGILKINGRYHFPLTHLIYP